MSFPIPSVNVTDLNIDHLHLDEIILDTLSLTNVPGIEYVSHAYVLLWMLFSLILIQTMSVGFLVVHTYRENKRARRLHKLNQEFMET